MGMDRKIEKKGWLRRYIYYVILGTIILGFIFYQLVFADHSSKLNVEIEKITIGKVNQDIFQDLIAVTGTVEPLQTIYLDATEGGRVEEIFILEGDMVKKDDIILKLSNDNLLLEISNNEAQVAQAINEIKNLRITLENQKLNNQNQLLDLYYDLLKLQREHSYNLELFSKELVSKEELNLSIENYEKNKKRYKLFLEKANQDSLFMNSRLVASEEMVEAMQDKLVIIRNRLSKLLVKAPVNGELATLTPKIGEVISYGNRIGSINILDSYKLRVEIDEYYIARVKKKLKGECEFSNQIYKIFISKIYPEVVGGRFAIDMEFIDSIPGEIRIGQTSRISMELGESANVVLIPRGSFYQSTGGQWIFVLDESKQFALKRNIHLGRQNPKYYEVIEGLQSGEEVIVSSYENFGEVDKLILK
jgi:HlyD family secretion protein